MDNDTVDNKDDVLADIQALVDIHRTPWSSTGWGLYPAAITARRISDALDAGRVQIND